MRIRMHGPTMALVAGVIALHAGLWLTGTTYYMTQITMSAYYALVVIGLCLLMGYAGQASLGQAGFFAIGGYLAGLLTTHNLAAMQDSAWVRVCQHLGVLVSWQDPYQREVLSFSPWSACILALAATAAVALVIGLSVIRLKGHYLAMATLGFGLIVYRLALGTPLLGQADGISNVPPFPLPGGLQVNDRTPFKVQNYYIAWALVIGAMTLALHLVHSRVGRALRSIHESEEAAHSLGVNTQRYKLATFVLAAVFAGLGGVFLTHYTGSISPTEATVMMSVRYLAIVAVGGMASLWGALLMGMVLNFLSLRGVFGSLDDAVFGAILIAVMILAPQGLLRLPIRQIITSALTRRAHG